MPASCLVCLGDPSSSLPPSLLGGLRPVFESYITLIFVRHGHDRVRAEQREL